MYAVVKTGGKQYRVAKDDIIKVERLEGEAGDTIALEEVLMVGGDGKVTLGVPMVDGASVAAEILEQARGDKIVVFKKRRRQNYRRKKGHRQNITVLRVTDILTGGAKAATKKKAAPKKEAAPKAEKAEAKSEIIDDVSLIGGVGPVLKKKLAEYGITSLKQIAELDADAIAKMDEELTLGGRVERDEWVEQAKELLAGKPPRAKTDKAAAKKAEKE